MWFMFNVIAFGILAGGWLLIKALDGCTALQFRRDEKKARQEVDRRIREDHKRRVEELKARGPVNGLDLTQPYDPNGRW